MHDIEYRDSVICHVVLMQAGPTSYINVKHASRSLAALGTLRA